MVWKYETQNPIVANPLIKDGIVYIGSSDGHFRALNLQNGKLKWEFDSVKGFVVTTPLFYNNKIYFGTWGNRVLRIKCSEWNISLEMEQWF